VNSVVLLFVLGLAAVIAIGVVSYRLEKKRRERLLQWCLNRGWSYVDEDPSLVDRWSGAPFGQGDHRRARSVITGTEKGRPFTAFEYSYQTHTTDSKGNRSSTTHRFGVCAVGLPAYLPTLQVTREDVFRRMAGAIGLSRDLELESEDFNRTFVVSARDPKFASDVLTPRTMQYLLTVPDVQWRIEGTAVLSWDTGRMQPEQIVVTTAVLDRVLDGVPAFVWKDHGHDPATGSAPGSPPSAGPPAGTDPPYYDQRP
jgi:hypothetical protein